MFCYALATCFNGETINWYTPHQINPNSLFAQNLTAQWKKNISELCTTLEPKSRKTYTKNNYHLYILKETNGYCFIACDTQLNIQQVDWLVYHLLDKKVPLNEVGNDLEEYSQDPQIAVDLRKNIEELIAQQPRIEELIERTNHLPTISFQFHSHSEESQCVLM